jgi:serine/threonine-protein kinase
VTVGTGAGLTLLDRLSNNASESEVWRALDRDGRIVAVKRLARPREDLDLRLEREGQLLSRLGGQHHLVGCLDLVAQPRTLVLEFGGENNLADSIASGPPVGTDAAIRRGIEIGLELADAIGWLHRNGVVHRDVKPSNVVLSATGSVRLIDLGVAAHGSPRRGLPEDWVEEEIGSLGYAAPELLADATQAEPTLDVYGLGATLYELLSGRQPLDYHATETESELRARAIAAERPVPLADRGRFPHELSLLLAKALDPSPGRRHQSVDALANELSRLR